MTFNPQPKHEYFRSEPFQKHVRTLNCQRCGQFGMTQSSHSNWSWSGKGKSIKGDDLTAALCVECHVDIDQGAELSKSDRELFWLRAFFKTIKALFVAGKIKVVP